MSDPIWADTPAGELRYLEWRRSGAEAFLRIYTHVSEPLRAQMEERIRLGSLADAELERRGDGERLT